MPERTSYEPGTPSWVDLGTSDLEAAQFFYVGLFGWRVQDAGPVEETGGYAFFTLHGHNVAAVGPLQGEGQPPAWTTYFSTDDVDALAQRATSAGATALLEPMDVMDAGRLAVFTHPAAGVFGAWQPGRHIGAELVNDPGSFSWNELHTRDVGGAKAFVEPVLGLAPQDATFSGTTYTQLNVGGRAVAGMATMPPGVPEQVPAHWTTFFAVEDCDAGVARVEDLGGSLQTGPMDAEGVGRFAVVADPQGARFGLIAND